MAVSRSVAHAVAGTIRASVNLKKLRDDARIDPMDTFEAFPVEEVRRWCIDALPRRITITEVQAAWAETRVRDLLTMNDGLWKELLAWYLYAESEEELTIRALEFAINLCRHDPRSLGAISKLVAGRLAGDGGLAIYWRVPSLRWFLRELLDGIDFSLRQMVPVYSEVDWHQAERAIRRIVEVGDTIWLPDLETIYGRHEEGRVRPISGVNAFDRVSHRAILGEAVRLLKEAYEQEVPNLTAAFANYLERRGGVRAVAVELHYDQVMVTADAAKHGSWSVAVEVTTTRPEDRPGLIAALVGINVIAEAEGFTEPLQPAWTSGISQPREGRFLDDRRRAICIFSGQPTPGTNRFRLHFRGRTNVLGEAEAWEEIATTTGYVIVE